MCSDRRLKELRAAGLLKPILTGMLHAAPPIVSHYLSQDLTLRIPFRKWEREEWCSHKRFWQRVGLGKGGKWSWETINVNESDIALDRVLTYCGRRC